MIVRNAIKRLREIRADLEAAEAGPDQVEDFRDAKAIETVLTEIDRLQKVHRQIQDFLVGGK